MPSSAMRSRLMWELDPMRRSCKSCRKPLLMASATISEATPAATPAIEMPVMMPVNSLTALGAQVAGGDEEFKAHGGF